MTPETFAPIEKNLLDALCEANSQGRLLSQDAALAVIRNSCQEETEFAPQDILSQVLATHPEIETFAGVAGLPVLHMPALISRSYAGILDRKAAPLILMSEEIRRNSELYPRPVPLELFESPPFDLAPEQLERLLRTMAESPDYQDITFTTASTGAVYLFSTLHLERAHAAFLAERAETGLINDP